ncbi:MAG: hypothetical protein VYD39_00625 [Bacteroidota bacterium]|nr:hypothetical protein [Bacteroidota bacterium]
MHVKVAQKMTDVSAMLATLAFATSAGWLVAEKKRYLKLCAMTIL